ncbi:rsmB [Symbiodinium natans]|uniref:RsmB protein n=1 Tax=Symbiodinium natans TaxID=878477 RepID=A0A812UQJ4_9DINO|nr:rsmB [Symbiodinium natans]
MQQTAAPCRLLQRFEEVVDSSRQWWSQFLDLEGGGGVWWRWRWRGSDSKSLNCYPVKHGKQKLCMRFDPDDAVTLAKRLSVAWSLPLCLGWSGSRWMAERWLNDLGHLSAFQLGRAMCQPARITLRVNTLRTTRLQLMRQLSDHGNGRPPGGGVWQLPGYSEGLFEVQDEGSQILALATEARPGEAVLDYCAGRGGKTWLLCSLVAPDGRVTAWDVDAELRKQLRGDGSRVVVTLVNSSMGPSSLPLSASGLVRSGMLAELCGKGIVPEGPHVFKKLALLPGLFAGAAEARAKRASVTDLLEVATDKPSSQADVVLVDAPCSSCGVWRQRWALQESEIDRIAVQQLQILEEASHLVRVGGRLVYATCSLLRAENDAVAERFEEVVGDCFGRWPFRNGRQDMLHGMMICDHL